MSLEPNPRVSAIAKRIGDVLRKRGVRKDQCTLSDVEAAYWSFHEPAYPSCVRKINPSPTNKPKDTQVERWADLYYRGHI